MYYVQALYEVKGSKKIVEGARHNLPGIREVFKRSMSRGTGCILAQRESNGYLSREALSKLYGRVELAINAARADLAAYNTGGPEEAKLASEANDKLTRLQECHHVLTEALCQCWIDDDILWSKDPHVRECVAKAPKRTKRIARIRLALA